jgi:hypothetical protein
MKTLVPLVLLFGALAACGGAGGAPAHRAAAPGPSVTASARPSVPAEAPSAAAPPTATLPVRRAVTVADLDAMARRIFPGAHPAGCGDIAACPITDRLRTRVAQLSRTGPNEPGPVVQFCRCQNGASGMDVASEVTGSGGVAHVALHYGSNISLLDLIFVQQPDARLLLDDTQCTGSGSSTSIYAPMLAACQA